VVQSEGPEFKPQYLKKKKKSTIALLLYCPPQTGREVIFKVLRFHLAKVQAQGQKAAGLC
jgi:hypothetical protein